MTPNQKYQLSKGLLKGLITFLKGTGCVAAADWAAGIPLPATLDEAKAQLPQYLLPVALGAWRVTNNYAKQKGGWGNLFKAILDKVG